MATEEVVYDKTKLVFQKKLPTVKKLTETLGFTPDLVLVIHDRKLGKQEAVAKWLKTGNKLAYPVTAGERLKDLEAFPGHVKKIMKLIGPVSPQKIVVIGFGGGSVGDFAGFFASTFKRGVTLVHIPSTMLAAIDSAHGGKTALNVASIKNQVGSFYFASAVFICKDIFSTIPQQQVHSAAGELAKMALLSGGDFFSEAKDTYFTGLDVIWKFMPQTIDGKYKVLLQDPYEKSGERQILNLGHTFGHPLESYYGIPHGTAVGLGLVFSVYWSHHHGYLSFKDQEVVIDFLHDKIGIQKRHQFLKNKRALTKAKLLKLVSEDKKMTSPSHVNFVFLEKAGKAFRKTVTIDSFLTEAARQGWVTS